MFQRRFCLPLCWSPSAQLNKFNPSVSPLINVLEPFQRRLALSSLPLVAPRPPPPSLSHPPPTLTHPHTPLPSSAPPGCRQVFLLAHSRAVCGSSARRAWNNRGGGQKIKRKQSAASPSVFQQLAGDAGITMPEPVQQGTHRLFYCKGGISLQSACRLKVADGGVFCVMSRLDLMSDKTLHISMLEEWGGGFFSTIFVDSAQDAL